ncbi:hypothetical protein ARMSODRAFT_1011239 [Armillaria solidipes]|uniref:Uncharacterized protein n=1 Tax=Armillaria solidipes TaxID=1076256 RepID=A0A2H3C6J5_9AGAR|nr:hypothetical protein ARMSODRAFT_1011239 [Armillaria solidipes]
MVHPHFVKQEIWAAEEPSRRDGGMPISGTRISDRYIELSSTSFALSTVVSSYSFISLYEDPSPSKYQSQIDFRLPQGPQHLPKFKEAESLVAHLGLYMTIKACNVHLYALWLCYPIFHTYRYGLTDISPIFYLTVQKYQLRREDKAGEDLMNGKPVGHRQGEIQISLTQQKLTRADYSIRGSSWSLPVMRTSGRIIGSIAMISHVGNGGCMEMVSISNLGRAIESDIGIRQRWQRHGRWCSHCCRLGVVRRILGSNIDAQMDIAIATFVGCWRPDLAPTLPLALFHPPAPSPAPSPSTVTMPYLPPYPFNVLRPFPALSSSLSLPCLSSSSFPSLNACAHAVLANGI